MAPTVFDNPTHFSGSAHWQIKIYDGELDYESPHVNVLFKDKTWRINLRTLNVMDLSPPRRELPKEFLEEIGKEIEKIRKAWNDMYPTRKIDIETGERIKKKEAAKKKKSTKRKSK